MKRIDLLNKLKNFFINNKWLFLIIFLGLFLRLYRLDEIPGEMWGDVIEHYKLVQNLLQGKLIMSFWGGDGPFLPYLIAFFSLVTGLNFLTIKLTTVIIGLLNIITNYYLAEIYFKNKKIGLLTAFLTAVSFWTISFSRQGKPYGLTPLFLSLTLLFFIRKKYLIAGIINGIGMYTQASYWGFFLFSFLNWKMFFITFLISFQILFKIFSEKYFVLNAGSYLGEKFIRSIEMGVFKYFFGIVNNYWRNLKAFFYNGDPGFRHTIPYASHLDFISGIFFLIGFWFLIKELICQKKYKHLIFFFVILLAILPTSLDVINVLNNPNMGRTVALTVIIFLITSYGLFKTIKKNFLLMIFLLLILTINIYRYFIIYPKTLPNQNTPFGKIIAKEIDQYPDSTKVIIVGCCWGEWGQPEPGGISYNINNKNRSLIFIEDNDELESKLISLINKKSNVLVITSPQKKIPPQGRLKKIKKIEKNNWSIANFYEL